MHKSTVNIGTIVFHDTVNLFQFPICILNTLFSSTGITLHISPYAMDFAEYVEYCTMNGADTLSITTKEKFDLVASKIDKWLKGLEIYTSKYWIDMKYKIGVCLV